MKTLNLLILFIVLATLSVSGQAIQVIGQTAYVNNQASADHNIPTWGAVVDNSISTGLITGTVNDFVLSCNADAIKDAGWTYSQAQGFTYATINGNNTQEVSFEWKHVSRSSCGIDLSYVAHSEDTMAIDLLLTIAPGGGMNVGDSIIIYYKYSVFASGQTVHEGANEDPVYSNNFFNINGVDQLLNNFNFSNPPDASGDNHLENIMGEIHTFVGADFTLDVQSQINTHITNPFFEDLCEGNFEGEITFNLVPFTDISLFCNSILFSVDIGSDSEISDPNADGDEVFDPGDAYVVGSNYIPYPGGNGVINDASIFGSDPSPVPGNPLSAVPIGTGLPVGTYWNSFFDLDGMDNLDISLLGMPNSYGPNLPSMNIATTNNLHFASHFLISYDDDGDPNFTDVAGNVPVNSVSPITNSTFGTTTGKDEIVAVNLFPFAPSAFSTNGTLADENMIHLNFSPNPDVIDSTDDDIDALDYVYYLADTTNPGNYYYNGPQFYYWSPDHEAPYFSMFSPGPLNAGSVYETNIASSPGFVEVVNAQTHLGLAVGTDVDAFEFGLIWDNQFQRFGFALLFSVDTDDPLTIGIDESGGLSPSKIYASFLNGFHFEFSASPLYDDIDAITISPTSFNTPAPQLTADFVGTPTTCFVGDVVSFQDISTGSPTSWNWDFDYDGSYDSNIQNPTTSYSLPGVYTVNLTVGNLTGTANVTKVSYITVLPNNLIVSAGADVTICPGQLAPLNGSISGGVPPYIYSWTPSSTLSDATILNPIAMPLTTTSYTLTVIDAAGVVGTDIVTVFVSSSIIINSNSQNVSCANGSDGLISITVTGGTSPYSYSWSSGHTSPDIGNLVAGSYTLTVTDPNGCSSTATIIITEPPLLLLSLTGIDPSCYGAADGSITVNISGGTPSYSILWSTGESTATISNLVSGVYTLTVTDANGCIDSSLYQLGQPPQILLSITGNDASCNGNSDGSASSTVSGGLPPYFYLWSNGETTPDIYGLSASTYNLDVTDANGCFAPGSILISEPAIIQLSFAIADVTCFGDGDGAISLTVTGGTSPYTYFWSNNSTTQNLNGLSGGTYSVTVTDAQQCTGIGAAIVVEPANLTVVLTGTDATANGASDGFIVTIVAGGTTPYSFLWSNSATTQNISNLAAGWYTITVTDANSCTTSANKYIAEPSVNNPFQGWYFSQTDNNHSILIAGSTPITIDGVAVQNGSGLGVFYDSSGFLACAGYAEFQSAATAIAAWGDDSQTSIKDGFSSGEDFIWKVWDAATGLEYIAEPTYDVIFPNQGEYFANGLTSLTSLTVLTSDTQTIVLNQGWNLISTYIEAYEDLLDSIFAPIISDILIIKDCSGSVFWPAWNLNMIGSMNVTEAYWLYSLSNTSVDIIGDQVNPSTTPISLPSGWSCLSYLHAVPSPIITQLASIASDIIIVKNGNGSVYWPYFGVDLIGNMIPGQGYQICMSSPTTLIYPTIPGSGSKSASIPENKYYTENINTGVNMTLCIPHETWEQLPEIEDEIAVFTENDILSGKGVFTGDHLVITIWGDDEITSNIDGLYQGEIYKLRLWNNTIGERELIISDWEEGSDNYEDNGISIAKSVSFSDNNNSIELGQNIPNPAGISTKIIFSLPDECNIELILYNILGEKTETIAKGSYPSGEHTIQLDVSKYSKGTYFYKLISSDFTATKKMIIDK